MPKPVAYLARRRDSTAESALSAVLVRRQLGFLAIRLTFHRAPMVGFEVTFFQCATEPRGPAEPGEPVAGAKIAEPVLTDEQGDAVLPFMVSAGLYVCQVERQPATLVPTVPRQEAPYPLVTPIGRPYWDLIEAPEFVSHDHFQTRPDGEQDLT